uniref:Uncharacterized protein n=1 Tax=viral metagenome TaxID=1070528 RepID=A0A6C0JYC4_9ZZZZ
MTTFISNENKQMLWNIMIETDIFAGVDDNKYRQVVTLFEEVITKLNIEDGKQLNIKNKMVLTEMTSKLRLIKNSKSILSYELNPQYSSDYRLVTNKKPDAIDFTDDIHENIVVEDDLNRLIQSREQIIKEVMTTLPPPKTTETHENEKEINLLQFLNKDIQTKNEVFKDIKLTCQQLSDGFKKLNILMEKMESVINV